jgi:hypothetical protein
MAKAKKSDKPGAPPPEPTAEVYATANTRARDADGVNVAVPQFSKFTGPASSCRNLIAAGKAVTWDPDNHPAAVRAAKASAKAAGQAVTEADDQPGMEV